MDKGGLEYTIRVKNDSSNELAEFRRDVGSARTTFNDFKTDLQNTSAAVSGVRAASRALTSIGNPANTRKIAQAAQNIRLLKNDMSELATQANALGSAAVAINAVKSATRNIGNAAGFNKLIVNLEKLRNTNFITISSRFNVLTQSLLRFDTTLAQVAPRIAQVAADIRAIGSGVGAAAASAARGLAQIQVAQANSLAQQQATAARLAAQLATTQARAQAQQQTIAARTAAGIQVIQARAAAGIDRVTERVKRLGDTARVSQSQLVRLGTAFLAFQAFRFSTDAFKALVTGAIEFNSELEQAQIALTAILSSAGDVRDLQGELVTGARAFALAEGVAASQIKKLQVDALKTTATFRELLDAFKQGLAPGLTSGLDPDQIRQVTVLLTNAATAVGVQGNQLAEEIRSVISGTVDLRNTRLSRLLPRDFNEQMKAARAAGKTFEFLTKQFSQFGLLADKNAKTFSAALGRVRESFDLVIGAGALPFFNSLKDLLNTITSQLIDVNLDSITPKPEAIAAFRGISDGLATVVVEVKRLVDNLKATDVLNIGELIAEGFKLIGEVGGPVLEGVIKGVNAVAGIILPIIKATRQFAVENREFLTNASKILVLFTGIGQILTAVITPIGLLQLTIQKLTGTSLSLSQTVAVLGLSFQTLGLSLQNAILNRAADFNLLFGQAGNASDLFVGTFQIGMLKINKTIEQAKLLLQETFSKGENLAANETKERLKILEGVIKASEDSLAVKTGSKFANAVANNLAEAKKRADELTPKLEEINSKISRIFDDASRQNNALLFSSDIGASLRQLQADLLAAIKDGMKAGGEEGVEELNKLLGTVVAKPLIEADEIVDPKELEAAKQRLFELTDPFGAALQKKFATVLTGVEQLMATTADLIGSAVQSFTNLLADGLVDALDPSQDVDILERVHNFLGELLKLFISTFAQIAIARAIAFGIGGAAGGAGTSGAATLADGFPVGFAKDGGKVPHGRFQASPAHYSSLRRAFGEGGSVIGQGIHRGRPRGVPASDTVPAWLTPDEHVIRRAAVLKAGRDFAEFFNRGGVSRTMALEIMGRKRPKTVRVPTQAHFAGGGGVSTRQIVSAGSSGPQMAVIAGNDQAVQTLLRAGRQAFLRILQEDQQAVRGAIGVPG